MKKYLTESLNSTKIKTAFKNCDNRILTLYAKYGFLFDILNDDDIEFIKIEKNNNIDEGLYETLKKLYTAIKKLYIDNNDYKKLNNNSNLLVSTHTLNRLSNIIKNIKSNKDIKTIYNNQECFTYHYSNLYEFYKAYIYKEETRHSMCFSPLIKETVNAQKLTELWFNYAIDYSSDHNRKPGVNIHDVCTPVIPVPNGFIIIKLSGLQKIDEKLSSVINRDNSQQHTQAENIQEKRKYWFKLYQKLKNNYKQANWEKFNDDEIDTKTGMTKAIYKEQITNILKYVKEVLNKE